MVDASGDRVFAGEFTPNVALIVNNSKVTDHHAIIPTMEVGRVNINALGTDERNILLMICAKLISAVSDKHSYAETSVAVECSSEIFTAKGKTITHNGWMHIEEVFRKLVGKCKKGDCDRASLPQTLYEGQQFTAQTTVREGSTSPPKHYTEASLLASMETAGVEGVEEDIERKGLGTPATRAGIIENLVKSELLVRDKKNLLPTEKGVSLIKVLPDKVKSPLLTADWENNLKRMERGEVAPVDFIKAINSFIEEVVSTYGNAENVNATAFTSTNNTGGDVIGLCPRCGGNVLESPKTFICEQARNKSCEFVLWKDNKRNHFGQSIMKHGKLARGM